MNRTVLTTAFDFTITHKSSNSSLSTGDYVLKYLRKTLDIIKSSPDISDSIIGEFVKAGIIDHHLPYTMQLLVCNIGLSESLAKLYLAAQSLFMSVTFKPLEFKTLSLGDSVPFVVDVQTKLRTGGYGMVEKVFEGNAAFARKTIRDNYDTEKMMLELKILRLATNTGNPHLLRLRCAYRQGNQMCLVTYPWCEFDLQKFLDDSSLMPFWVKMRPKDRLILITDWMTCLASGLSALHMKNIKHQDLKPENVLLCQSGNNKMIPIICDYGLSKAFSQDSMSVKVQGTREYFPPEQLTGKVGRKGDVFSIGLIFTELGLLFFGQKSLKDQLSSGYYMDIAEDLEEFLAVQFSCEGGPSFLEWRTRFHELLNKMLIKTPEQRLKASRVWGHLIGMAELLGATPHCENISCYVEQEMDSMKVSLPPVI